MHTWWTDVDPAGCGIDDSEKWPGPSVDEWLGPRWMMPVQRGWPVEPWHRGVADEFGAIALCELEFAPPVVEVAGADLPGHCRLCKQCCIAALELLGDEPLEEYRPSERHSRPVPGVP